MSTPPTPEPPATASHKPTGSEMLVRDLNELSLLSLTSTKVISIFGMTALSYMLGVSWYEAARATMDEVARNNPRFTPLQWTYIYTASITIGVITLAIALHHYAKKHLKPATTTTTTTTSDNKDATR